MPVPSAERALATSRIADAFPIKKRQIVNAFTPQLYHDAPPTKSLLKTSLKFGCHSGETINLKNIAGCEANGGIYF